VQWLGHGLHQGKTRRFILRRFEMNLLEHYIKEILKVTERKTHRGTDIIEVEMIVDCYGIVEQTKHIFLPVEWEKAKKDGYYLA
jgi:hypothetical protein